MSSMLCFIPIFIFIRYPLFVYVNLYYICFYNAATLFFMFIFSYESCELYKNRRLKPLLISENRLEFLCCTVVVGFVFFPLSNELS